MLRFIHIQGKAAPAFHFRDQTAQHFVENMPVFPGGEEALLAFIGRNVRYPSAAKRMGIEGRVYLSFVIDATGAVTSVEILKGIGAGCDEEAIRVVEMLPTFDPGKQRGVPVNVRMQLPINFRLE